MRFQPRLSILCASMLTAALLSSTASFAAHYKGDYKNEVVPCVQPLMLKDGFYVGAQVGYDAYSVGHNTTAQIFPTVTSTTPTASLTWNSNRAVDGWVGGLLAGYGMYFNNYYLGVEVFGNGSGASRTDREAGFVGATSFSSNVTSRVRGSWGISALPGYKVNDSTLTYIRLGYNQANFKVSGNGYDSAGPTSVSGSKSSWQGGFNYGLGIETAVYQNVSIRGEYTYTDYNNTTHTYSGTAASPATTFHSVTTKVEPSDHQFMLALIYHFA